MRKRLSFCQRFFMKAKNHTNRARKEEEGGRRKLHPIKPVPESFSPENDLSKLELKSAANFAHEKIPNKARLSFCCVRCRCKSKLTELK